MGKNITLSLDAVRAIVEGDGTPVVIDYLIPFKAQELAERAGAKDEDGVVAAFEDLTGLMQFIIEKRASAQPDVIQGQTVVPAEMSMVPEQPTFPQAEQAVYSPDSMPPPPADGAPLNAYQPEQYESNYQ